MDTAEGRKEGRKEGRGEGGKEDGVMGRKLVLNCSKSETGCQVPSLGYSSSHNSELFSFSFTCLFFSEPRYLNISGSNSVIAKRDTEMGGWGVKNLTEAKHPKFIGNYFHMMENIFFLPFFVGIV